MLTPKEAAALLRQQDNVLILTHRRPDGDTIGCAAGLCAALRQLGKTAYLLYNPEITDTNRPYAEPYWGPEDFQPDFVVSVDIAAHQLLFPAAEPWFEKIDLAIDHHPSFENFGAAQCVDASRAACGEILYEICLELGDMTQDVALPLYAAITTDTGCFVYSNTTVNSHLVAAALMETGIPYQMVNKRHFRSKSRTRLALEGHLLGNMEFFQEGRGVFLIASQALIQSVGASESNAEDLSALSSTIEGVDCGVTLRELKPNQWKVSLRTGANGRINATKVCQLLGGGGHAMAAGATLEGSLETVKAQVLAAVEQVAGQ